MATKKSTAKSASAAKSRRASHSGAGQASNAASQITTDHDVIRQWAEDREGDPSHVKRTGGEGDIGILRIDFPGYSGEDSLEPISWDEWFEKFDERGLAFLYQEETAGGAKSNFNKIISRETAEEDSGRHKASSGRKTKTAGGS